MVFDHTPLTPPLPEAHLWSPYCDLKKKSARNGTYTIKNGFLLKREIYIACKYAS